MICRYLDGIASKGDFKRVYLGPGVYLLFDGRASDGNITYVGRSFYDVVMRVSAHRDKDFTRVGVILPKTTSDYFIANLEALVLAEYIEEYGELPPYNRRREVVRRLLNWHRTPRRRSDVDFD